MIKYRKEGNIMGSVQNISKCPRCGKETYFSDYYYRTGESYEFCTCCGKNRSISFKRDDTGEFIREDSKYPLSETYFVLMECRTYNIGKEIPVSIIKNFNTQLAIDYINGKVEKMENHFGSFCIKENNEWKRLWYIPDTIDIEDGYFIVHKAILEHEETDGYGIIDILNKGRHNFTAIKKGTSKEMVLKELEDVKKKNKDARIACSFFNEETNSIEILEGTMIDFGEESEIE